MTQYSYTVHFSDGEVSFVRNAVQQYYERETAAGRRDFYCEDVLSKIEAAIEKTRTGRSRAWPDPQNEDGE